MNLIIRFLGYSFSRLLLLYPGSFRKEFADEMQIVFKDAIMEAVQRGFSSLLIVSIRELGGLLFGIVRELWYELARREVNMDSNGKNKSNPQRAMRASIKHALLAIFPFVLFGLTCMLCNLQLPARAVYVYLAFSLIVLLGLVIGFAANVPIWAISYLGWSIVMAWWWSMMPADTLSGSFSPDTHNQLLGWRSWLLLLLAIGTGLLLARSFRPLRRLVSEIGEDWTLLSFMMYSFPAFTLLIYDENHHPYLAVFMLGSTLVITLSAWFYLRNPDIWKKLFFLLSGFVLALLVSNISDATWDWAAYNGLPERPPQAWYDILGSTIVWALCWAPLLLWPVVVGLAQYTSHKSSTA
jgi:hypothetical protein